MGSVDGLDGEDVMAGSQANGPSVRQLHPDANQTVAGDFGSDDGSAASPSQQPTGLDRRFSDDSIEFVHCDFSSLDSGVLLSDAEQNDKLERDCSLTMSGANGNGKETRQIEVFNTAKAAVNGMFNLGSPHSSCGGHRGVNGSGGHAESVFANCEAQGNVLVLEQEEDGSGPVAGGCMNVDFVDPVVLDGLSLLDLPDQETVKITVSLFVFCFACA